MKTTTARLHRPALGVSLAAALALSGLALAGPATAAGQAQSISVDFPASVTASNAPISFSGAASNSASTPLSNARYDISLSGIAGLKASQVALSYETAPGSGTYAPVPLTGTGVITGYFGPQGGFTMPATTTTVTNFKIALAPDTPGGTLSSVVSLDQLSGQGTETVATPLARSSSSTSIVPTVSLGLKLPGTVTADNKPVAFSGSLTNNSDTAVANLRYDVTLTGVAGLKASQVALGYETSPGSGDYTQVPLTGTGTITGYFGPESGFSLPAGAVNTTNFELAISGDAPAGAIGSVVSVDQVDPAAPNAVTATLAAARQQVVVSSATPVLSTTGVGQVNFYHAVTISGTAPAGATVGIFFAGRGVTTFEQRRSLLVGTDGKFSTSYIATDDMRYYAAIGTSRSATVLTLLVPTVDGPLTRTVKKNASYTITGTGAPRTTITIHFHNAGEPANSYSILRTVSVASNGTWARPYLAVSDERFFITSNTNGTSTPVYTNSAR
jgi:hypothetical protein